MMKISFPHLIELNGLKLENEWLAQEHVFFYQGAGLLEFS